MALLDGVLQTSGGLLSKLSGGGGVLSTAVGPLQSRLASMQAAGSPQAKIQALAGTLGMRLKSGGILSAGGAGGGGLLGKFLNPASSTPSTPAGTATDMGYQVSSSGRVYGTPTPPAGIAYR